MNLKLAEIKDYDEFYKLKSESSNVFWTGWNEKPNYENLKTFYINAINNNKTKEDRKIYLAYKDSAVVGYVYIDYVNDDTFHISPAISEEHQGKGFGKELIGLALLQGLSIGYKNAEAYIREDNIASQKCFLNNGFIKTEVYENKYIPNQNKDIKMIRYLYQGK